MSITVSNSLRLCKTIAKFSGRPIGFFLRLPFRLIAALKIERHPPFGLCEKVFSQFLLQKKYPTISLPRLWRVARVDCAGWPRAGGAGGSGDKVFLARLAEDADYARAVFAPHGIAGPSQIDGLQFRTEGEDVCISGRRGMRRNCGAMSKAARKRWRGNCWPGG